ncbi:MAG: hypothetical protein KGI89_04875 [Euryarchaeota archaeon]|nr:hypothetical protein [Euryarchaeota archaeon]MDE2045667.1 hypothetical protein [Thermoplasmata archaeon]
MLPRVAGWLKQHYRTAALLLLVALVAVPGSPVGGAQALAVPPHAAPHLLTPGTLQVATPGTSLVPAIYGNTAITTTDSNVGGNTAMNFSARFSTAISLSAGENVNVTLNELIGFNIAARDAEVAAIGFWVHYDPTSSTTVVWPRAVFSNRSITHDVVDTAISLPNPGTWVFRMTHLHGYWWTFSTIGGQPIGSGVPAWQNGTYLLNYTSAVGTNSFAGIAPTLYVNESGASLPFPSSAFQGIFDPAMQFNTTTAGYQPANGEYRTPSTASYAVPMAGFTQCFGVPSCPWAVGNDTVLVNYPAPLPSTTTDKTFLWGVAPPPPVSFHTYLGSETVDSTLSNVSGVQLTIHNIPSVIPPNGKVATHESILPLNSSSEIYLGFADINISFTGIGNYQGFFPFYAVVNKWTGNASFGVETSPLSPGSHTITMQNVHGWWWETTVDNSSGIWTVCFSTTGCTGNGTLLLNESTAWGETNTPFYAQPGGRVGIAGFAFPYVNSTQPMITYFGNMSKYSVKTGIQMLSSAGSWTTPYAGYAWSWDIKNSNDVLVGSTQQPWAIPAGVVLVENLTGQQAVPLSNTTAGSPTAVWLGTLVTAIATPSTLASGHGLTNITATVLSGGAPFLGAVVTLSDPKESVTYGGYSTSLRSYGPGSDTYSGTYWANATLTADTWDNLTITASGTGHSTGTVSVKVLITPPLSVAARLVGMANGASVKAGATVSVGVWTNISNVGVANAWPAVSVSPAGEGTTGANSTVSTGYYTVPITISATPRQTTATISVAAVGLFGTGYNLSTVGPSFTLTVQESPLTLSPITVSASSPSSVSEGATVTFTVTVSGPTGPVSGATVTITSSPAIATSCGSPGGTPCTTSSSGVATWTVTAPSSLTAATTYTFSATATAQGYAPPASPATTSITVVLPAPNNNGNGNALSGTLLYAIIGAVVAVVVVLALVMMMRKKKGAPPMAPMAGPPPGTSMEPPPEGGVGG